MKVVITGGSKGIGRAIALAFAREGADISLCARGTEALQEVGEELSKLHPEGRHLVYQADGSRKEELLAFCREVEARVGPADVLVNNLGLFRPGRLLEETEGVLEESLAGNLMPAYYCSRFFAPFMKARKSGHIFNICSVSSLVAHQQSGAYTVSKHALLGLSRSLREELRPYGVKVSAVLPGSTWTASWEGSGLDPARFVDPDDIAALIVQAVRLHPASNLDELHITPVSGKLE